MKGRVLEYSVQENTGLIAGDNGERYRFAGAEWQGDVVPSAGVEVDFVAEMEDAVSIYSMQGEIAQQGGAPEQNGKPRVAYILLGLFLGVFGVHNFFAGYAGRGVAQLLITICSFGLLAIAVWIWVIIEICTVEKDARDVAFS